MPGEAKATTRPHSRKRLRAELLESSRMISIGNYEGSLGGPLLCQTATQHFIKVRLLGFSKAVLIVNRALLFAIGNNLKLYDDLLRRGRHDACEERSESRTFAQPPLTVDSERLLPRLQRSLANRTNRAQTACYWRACLQRSLSRKS